MTRNYTKKEEMKIVWQCECDRCGRFFKDPLPKCPYDGCRAPNLDYLERERERTAWNLGTVAASKYKKTWQG